MASQDPNEAHNFLSKTIKLKTRSLKPYEKKIVRKGEYRYDIPIQPSIPSGQPTVCYARNAEGQIDQQADRSLQPSQRCGYVPASTCSQLPTVIPRTCNLEAEENESMSSEETENIELLSIAESYFHNLKLEKGISIFSCENGHGSILVVKDFCTQKKKIMKGKWILIQRRCVFFDNGEARWIYWCSCNQAVAKEVSSLHSHLSITEKEFNEHYPNCIHLEVSRMIYNQYDLIHEIEPHFEVNHVNDVEDHDYSMAGYKVFEVPDSKIVCCGGKETLCYGLVDLEKRRLSCVTCSSSVCNHTSIIRRIRLDGSDNIFYELIQSMSCEESNNVVATKVYKPKLISFKPIPFERSSLLSDNLKLLPNEKYVLLPDLDICPSCKSTLTEGDPIAEDWVAYDLAAVITNTCIEYVKVYYRPCSSCGQACTFEGQSKSLLNLGSYLVGYDVLRSYMHCFLHGRRPLYTFYQSWCDIHLDYGNSDIQEVFSYQKLRYAWISFLKLLDIDFNQGFSCPTCDKDDGYPDTIICDGTSLSFQRRMWEWKESVPKEVLNLSTTRFSDRVFIQDAVVRSLLKRYASAGEVTHVKFKPLDQSEKKILFTEIKQISIPLHRILQSTELDQSIFKIYRKLLLCLASPSPVCVLLKPFPDVQNLLNLIGKGVQLKEDPKLWTLLHHKIPILFDILDRINPSDELKSLLEELWEVAITPFVDALEDTSEPSGNDEESLSFFPSLPKVRDRGQFSMDRDKGNARRKGDVGSCRKTFSGHPTLLPGIFTMFCPHGVCYGFQVMEYNESPNVPFSIMRSRFRKAPKVVIYDNACKLQDYCLNRDPLFFQHTEFYVDRLHWDNHTACSLAYELDLYPQHNDVNSQCNEQANAGLKRIKDQLSYMTADNFMTHCSLYLWNKNKKVIKTIEEKKGEDID